MAIRFAPLALLNIHRSTIAQLFLLCRNLRHLISSPHPLLCQSDKPKAALFCIQILSDSSEYNLIKRNRFAEDLSTSVILMEA